MIHSEKKQIGAVLMVSLLILVVLSILGITGMKTTVLEEKMSGNYRDNNLAFQAAEASLRDAELWLKNEPLEPYPNNSGTNGVWTLNAMNSGVGSWWKTLDSGWWTTNAVSYTGTLNNISTVPLRIIEHKDFIPDSLVIGGSGPLKGTTYYQITTKGTGGTDQARVLLQSTVARRF